MTMFRKIFQNPFLYVGFAYVNSVYASGDSDMLSSVLSGLINMLTSTPAKLMFVLSIIGVGYGTLALGQIPKERAVTIVIGIGIIFSASYIAQKMGLAT